MFGSSGGAGIHTFTVGSASSITVGMAVTGTGNIGENDRYWFYCGIPVQYLCNKCRW